MFADVPYLSHIPKVTSGKDPHAHTGAILAADVAGGRGVEYANALSWNALQLVSYCLSIPSFSRGLAIEAVACRPTLAYVTICACDPTFRTYNSANCT